MSRKLKNWTPPGIDPQKELREHVTLLLLSVFCACTFFYSYYSAYQLLFPNINGKESLVPVGHVPPFWTLMRFPILGFLISAAIMAVRIIQHYASYRQGSRSIYLMRRLPDRWLIHRQCLTAPLLGLLTLGIGALVMVGLSYFVYIHFTPVSALPTLSIG